MKFVRVSSWLLLPALLLLGGCRHGHPSRIVLTGNMEAVTVDLSFRVAGKILERPVDEGQSVQEGQLIARLDARDLEQQVSMRTAEVATAKAAYAALLAGSRPEEIQAAHNQLIQAQAELKRLEADEARFQALHAQKIVAARDHDAVRAAFEAIRAKVAESEARYALVQKGPRIEDIQQAKARHEQAQQALALAQTQLSYATLTAPSKGVIFSKNAEAKEYVAPGTAVVTMADLQHLYLRAYLEETDLGKVKLGHKVRVTTDTFPGKTYEGQITFISSEAEFTPKSVQTRKERVKLVYRVKIELKNPEQELKPGMPADAEIQL